MDLLLAGKADVNAEDNNGVTPFGNAVVGGHTDVAKLLVANKAKVDARIDLMVMLLHSRKDLAEFLQLGPQQGPITIIGGHE